MGRRTLTITNTGDETLKLLNDPRGVLDSFPENTFSITDPIGSSPSFVGAKVNPSPSYCQTCPRAHVVFFCFQVKFSPEYAAGLNDPSVFTILAPGASIDVTHDRKWNHTRDRFWGHRLTK